MSLDAIICDWNGTLTSHRDEEPIFRKIAVDLFKNSLPWHPFRMARLLVTKNVLEKLKCESRQDGQFDWVTEMFRVYNEKIIKGVPVSFITRSVEGYAREQQTLEQLDHRILKSVAQYHRSGIATGILSAGYGYGIRMVLKAAGYDCFDFYEANEISKKDGRAIGFNLDIYRNKAQVLVRLLKDKNLSAKNVVYIGDSEDDAGCFELVGYPVVAFLAPDETKEKFARKYKVFAPATEADLAKYLASAG